MTAPYLAERGPTVISSQFYERIQQNQNQTIQNFNTIQ